MKNTIIWHVTEDSLKVSDTSNSNQEHSVTQSAISNVVREPISKEVKQSIGKIMSAEDEM